MSEHVWHRPRQFRWLLCCSKCGILKRKDGQNKPCPGYVAVTLRELPRHPAPSGGER